MSHLTIDNSPFNLDVSWEKQKPDLQPIDYLKAPAISIHTEIASFLRKSTKLDKLFALHDTDTTWASFSPPANFFKQSNRFFRRSLVPNLDTEEALESLEFGCETSHSNLSEEQQLEKIRLHAFLKELASLDAILSDIYFKILQYRKG